MGIVAVGTLFVVIRGLWTGMLFNSEGEDTVLDDQPLGFAVTLCFELLMAGTCAALAAGYDLAQIWKALISP
jgi:hypothetical protein